VNRALADAGAPLQVRALSSIWTVVYTQPSRYHWMLQYYLREAGLALSWVGTGRWIFGLDCSDADFDEVVRRAVAAGRAMEEGGWWDKAWQPDARSVRRGLRTEWWQALTRRRVAGSVLAQ
jgi:glutamate-1-semialdehyde 2,1-aminomutase